MNTTQISDFYYQLALLVKSDLPLPESILTLEEHFKSRKFKKVIEELSGETAKGRTLAEAMEAYPEYFTPFNVMMIRAGEDSGTLSEVLAEIAQTAQMNNKLITMMREISLYPIFVIWVAMIIFFLIFRFFIPEFDSIYSELLAGEQLPLFTELTVAVSRLTASYSIVLLFLAILPPALFLSFIFSNKLKLCVLSFMAKVPFLRGVFHNMMMARICSLWSFLLRRKTPATESFNVLSSLVEMPRISRALKRVAEHCERGVPPADAIDMEKDISSLLVLTAVHVSEEELSGELDNLSIIFRSRAASSIRSIGIFWEIVLMFFMLLVAAGVVLSLFMPLIRIVDYLGR